MDVLLHEREYVIVESGRRKYLRVISESVFNAFGYIASCKIVDYYFIHALFFKLCSKKLNCFSGISIYGCV